MTQVEKWRANGLQTMLLEQLRNFFGPLSEEAHRRIGKASPKQLKLWALAVPMAARDGQSIDDGLNGSSH